MVINWVVPLSSNSHHQDYYILVGDPASRTKPSFATIASWEGVVHPTYKGFSIGFPPGDVIQTKDSQNSNLLSHGQQKPGSLTFHEILVV